MFGFGKKKLPDIFDKEWRRSQGFDTADRKKLNEEESTKAESFIAQSIADSLNITKVIDQLSDYEATLARLVLYVAAQEGTFPTPNLRFHLIGILRKQATEIMSQVDNDSRDFVTNARSVLNQLYSDNKPNDHHKDMDGLFFDILYKYDTSA